MIMPLIKNYEIHHTTNNNSNRDNLRLIYTLFIKRQKKKSAQKVWSKDLVHDFRLSSRTPFCPYLFCHHFIQYSSFSTFFFLIFKLSLQLKNLLKIVF